MSQSTSRTSSVLLTATFLLCAPPCVEAARSYRLTDLGSLSPVAINAVGQIAGNKSINGATQHAFLWTQGVALDLGTLGGSNSVALGLNNHGDVVGRSDLYPGFGNKGAFVYRNERMIALANLGRGDSAANGINDNGVVVGYSDSGTGSSGATIRAVYWDDPLTVHSLSTKASYANAINGTNAIVGGDGYSVLWSAGNAVTAGGFGGIPTEAVSINDIGEVVGRSRVLSPNPYDVRYKAYLWRTGNSVDIVGNAPGYSLASDINNRSQVVGSYLGYSRAFIWEEGALVDLNSLLLDAGDWILQSAVGINDSGQIIGFANNNRTFLLTPVPEPRTTMLIAAGLAMLIVGRRRLRQTNRLVCSTQ